MNVLLVEDDPLQAGAIDTLLSSLSCRVTCVSHGEHAVRFLKNNPAALVVLDWQIPKLSGIDVLRWIRTNLGDEPAVLFLTGRTLEVDIAAAFEAGADEYIVKPVREIEFTARVKALLRRHLRVPGNVELVRMGEYTVDPNLRSIMLNGKKAELTPKEYLLAAYLFNNIGMVVSRDILSKLGWGRELDYSSRTIDTHIYRLRHKLALRPENSLRLSAVYSHGYRLEQVAAPIPERHQSCRLSEAQCTP